MQIKGNNIKELNIGDLFSGGDRYLIPVYQRNYAWGKQEIEQLLFDIRDYFDQDPTKNYYVGTLIADRRDYKNETIYETIDGQQRLTTFNIICLALKSMGVDISQYFSSNIISFESRKNSDLTLDFFLNKGTDFPANINFNTSIYEGLILAKVQLQVLLEREDFKEFLDYFFNKVVIIRVLVPEDTDLNHYFEIMNSRGEQLEKHEILKARLMKELNDEPKAAQLRNAFSQIWDAVSDMNTYVQMNFSKEKRPKIFGPHWYNFECMDYIQLYSIIIGSPLDQNIAESQKVIDDRPRIKFLDIIEPSGEQLAEKLKNVKNDNVSSDWESSQFQSAIDFPNFLIHVLKMMGSGSKARLDDKKLLTYFNDALGSNHTTKAEFVLSFSFNLLKAKFLFDQFVLKREYAGAKSSWTLKMLKYYPVTTERKQPSYNYKNTFGADDKNVLLLLSMFHVSNPSLMYKYWLFGTLSYLFANYNVPTSDISGINAAHYSEYLVNLAKRLMRFRYLSEEELDYDLILNDDAIPGNSIVDIRNNLKYGKIRNNLVFNYIDYLLIQEAPGEYLDFEFSFRSSVEHYYPQNPIGGKPIDAVPLNCIGNLCLISHGTNSRLSNHLPSAKKKYYTESKSKDSVKQLIMMNEKDWGIDEIARHEQRIVNLLAANL